jgi:hypothetical protein
MNQSTMDFAVHFVLMAALVLTVLYAMFENSWRRSAEAYAKRIEDDCRDLADENAKLADNLREARKGLLRQTLRADKLSEATAHAVGRHAAIYAELEAAREKLGQAPSDNGQRRRSCDGDEAAIQQTMADAIGQAHYGRVSGLNLWPSGAAGERRFGSPDDASEAPTSEGAASAAHGGACAEPVLGTDCAAPCSTEPF